MQVSISFFVFGLLCPKFCMIAAHDKEPRASVRLSNAGYVHARDMLHDFPSQRRRVNATIKRYNSSFDDFYSDFIVGLSQTDVLLLPERPRTNALYIENVQDFRQNESCKTIYMEIFKSLIQKNDSESDAAEGMTRQLSKTNTLIHCEFVKMSVADLDFGGGCVAVAETTENFDSWFHDSVTVNLQTFIEGGLDSYKLPWPGVKVTTEFSVAIGQQLLNLQGYRCSLESPCVSALDCSSIGSWNIGGTAEKKQVLGIPWINLVVASLQNINLQLLNQYNAIKGATIGAILAAFNIDDFFPTPDSTFALNSLTGLGTIFSIAGGFIPAIGPGLSAAGAILPAIGTFLGSSIDSSSTQNIAQKEFAPKVQLIYSQLTTAMDNVTARLFAGESVEGVNITNMIGGGSWHDPEALIDLPEIEQQMKIEILSRSIDSLWKTAPSNKMWVQFLALRDSRNDTRYCDADKSGPQDSKYCADSGVYYMYNFIENGDLAGYLGYPWGGDKLPSLDLNLKWATEASAKSYKLSKRNGLDPFKFNQTQGTTTFLNEAVLSDDGDDSDNGLAGYAGRYPGSWTIPVCDTMTWGKDWNYNYTTRDAKGESTEIDILGHV